jgi:hypothetical protein
MTESFERLFDEHSEQWLEALAPFQRTLVDQLIASGKTYDQAAEAWLTASPANTAPFGAMLTPDKRNLFKEKLVLEIENFLCGAPEYEKERNGLLGEKSAARTYVVSAIAVALAPSLGVSAPFLSPAIALILASFGKITLNAWCAARREGRVVPPMS